MARTRPTSRRLVKFAKARLRRGLTSAESERPNGLCAIINTGDEVCDHPVNDDCGDGVPSLAVNKFGSYVGFVCCCCAERLREEDRFA